MRTATRSSVRKQGSNGQSKNCDTKKCPQAGRKRTHREQQPVRLSERGPQTNRALKKVKKDADSF
ncbi:hypothetical protein [Bacillus sp. T3]|uniref:hypothetical protein n=1 Tax=Bacillus sp. T3 TaxID=467262 RepID=UPI002982B3ED|nr:hypothetical protein [Bacillus sp. T3]